MKNIKLSKALRDLSNEIYVVRDSAEGKQVKHLDHAAFALEVLAHVVSGKSIERSFGAPGDWGYGTPIGDGVLAMLREPLIDDRLEWHYVEDELPDDETRVLVAFDDDCTGEPSFGFHSEDQWFLDELSKEGKPMVSALSVYAWAHTPAVPPRKGGAK